MLSILNRIMYLKIFLKIPKENTTIMYIFDTKLNPEMENVYCFVSKRYIFKGICYYYCSNAFANDIIIMYLITF